MCKVSTPSRWGDAFGINSRNDHWFGSSVLNVIFEGLLLRASGRHHVKAGGCRLRELG
jgi:hypothetical protein